MDGWKIAGAVVACVFALIIGGAVVSFVSLYIALGDPEGGWPGPDGSRTVNTPSTIYWSPFPSSSP